MKEVKNPKKPLIYYYLIVLLILLSFNFIAMPMYLQRQVREVDYGTFMTMTEEGDLGQVQIEDNKITFTNAENTAIYKTGRIDDPNLVERLKASGAKFSSSIVEEMPLFLNILLNWVLPVTIFIGIGQLISRKLTQRAGGSNSMMFGAGKSSAKVYVQSSSGIKFDDVAGEDEAKENLAEIVDYLHNSDKYKEVGASMPKGLLLVGPPGTGKTDVRLPLREGDHHGRGIHAYPERLSRRIGGYA